MHAAVVRAFDAPPSYAEFADPIPEAGELAVTVTAAGLHRLSKALPTGRTTGRTGDLPSSPEWTVWAGWRTGRASSLRSVTAPTARWPRRLSSRQKR